MKLVLALLLLPAIALAHEVGLSRGTYFVRGAEVVATFDVARREADGARFAEGVRVTADGAACAGTVRSQRPSDNDGLEIEAVYRCPAAPATLQIHLALSTLAPGHRHLGRVLTDTSSAAFVADAGAPSFTTTLGEQTELGFGALFALGVEHILTGFDHLVFLLGLVLVGGTWRALLGVVTAFTLAHSITLGLAATGVYAPDPRWIEPAIALSIAYVGVENFFVRDVARRWRITFAFGLLHGFGFGGALAEIGLAQGDALRTLLAFNLGVEAGQVAVLAAVLPLLALARRRPWFAPWGVAAVSAAVTLAGVAWFIERVV